ncbi:MAG: DUF1566 domain-containing protein [Deltaproteobacteria bacterium]|nr:DUF1566 domain-containing protein [Deltaproteobacteria bacterium]
MKPPTMTFLPAIGLVLMVLLAACNPAIDDTGVVETPWPTTLVDSDQLRCFDTDGEIACPSEGADYHGQDAQYVRYAPSYRDNGDGTVTDEVTGLVWQWEQVDGMDFDEAEAYCEALDLGGRAWRVPTIKESYSLIQFDGATGSGSFDQVPDDAVPYIDDSVFDFAYGDTSAGDRFIDVQFITTTVYMSMAFADHGGLESGEACFFGSNLADGRIKCYPTGSTNGWQLRCVSGDEGYGDNDLEDNGDDTVTDHATGLTWLQSDSTVTMDWVAALSWCEGLDRAGHDDWRLPDAKELQSIVDYGRSPDTTGSPAIDPVFQSTAITDEAGDENFGWYWTSTTHLDGMVPAAGAAYITFGEALGYMQGFSTGEDLFLDVHGAGAQRSDPKVGAPVRSEATPRWEPPRTTRSGAWVHRETCSGCGTWCGACGRSDR